MEESTHIHDNILDVVLTNNPHNTANIHIDNSSTINTNSDHYLIFFEHVIHNNHITTADPNQLQNSPTSTRRSQSSIQYMEQHTHSIQPTSDVSEMGNNMRQVASADNSTLTPQVHLNKTTPNGPLLTSNIN